MSFAMSGRFDSITIKLARSKDSLTRGDAMINEEVATNPTTMPVTIAPVRPAAAPAAAKSGPSGANANTPEATQTGRLTIDAIAPAAMSFRQATSDEDLPVRVCA